MGSDKNTSASADKHRQYRQSLGDQVSTIEQEARMVLPGIQALFGFQLVAVFNQGFKIYLAPVEQAVHLIALLLVAISAVLVVAPAAYHRQSNHQISEHFVQLSSNFLAWALAPLAVGTCLDIYIVARVILESVLWSCITAGLISLLYAWIWFLFPHLRARKIENLPLHELGDEEKKQ